MRSDSPLLRFGAVLVAPGTAIASIAADPPSGARAFFGAAVWLGLLPPLFAAIGTMTFGWRLGVEPLFLPAETVVAIGVAYFVLLLFGFLSTAVGRAVDGAALTAPTRAGAAASRS